MRIFYRREFFARRLHIDTEARERVERLQNIILDLFGRRKFIRKKCRRRVRRFDERQRMLADPVIPIRMRDPRDLELVLETKLYFQIVTARELVKDDAVIDPLDPGLSSIPVVK